MVQTYLREGCLYERSDSGNKETSRKEKTAAAESVAEKEQFRIIATVGPG
jgi:hypothetical protein